MGKVPASLPILHRSVQDATIGKVAGPSGLYPDRPLISNETDRILSVPSDYPTVEDALGELPIIHRGGIWEIRVDPDNYAEQEDIVVPAFIGGDTRNGSEAGPSGVLIGDDGQGGTVTFNSVYVSGVHGAVYIGNTPGGTEFVGTSPYDDDDEAAINVQSSRGVAVQNVNISADLRGAANSPFVAALLSRDSVVKARAFDVGQTNVYRGTWTKGRSILSVTEDGMSGNAATTAHYCRSTYVGIGGGNNTLTADDNYAVADEGLIRDADKGRVWGLNGLGGSGPFDFGSRGAENISLVRYLDSSGDGSEFYAQEDDGGEEHPGMWVLRDNDTFNRHLMAGGRGFGNDQIANLSGVVGDWDGQIRYDDGTNTISRTTPCVWDDTNAVWRPVNDPSGGSFT